MIIQRLLFYVPTALFASMRNMEATTAYVFQGSFNSNHSSSLYFPCWKSIDTFWYVEGLKTADLAEDMAPNRTERIKLDS